jgi:hypothetical protein
MSGGPRFAGRAIRAQGRLLVSICDAELLGSTLKGDGVEVKIDAGRYEARLMDAVSALELVRKGDIIDLIGQNIVRLAIDNGLGHPDGVKVINGVPLLFIYRV